QRFGRIKGNVIEHHQVEPAIAIEIEEACGCSPASVLNTSGARNVRECAVAVVDEQSNPAPLRYQAIRVAVIVHVADGPPHPVPGHVETRAVAYVTEMPVRLLMIQLVGDTGVRPGIMYKVDVEAPVAVVVQQGRTRADNLRHKVSRTDL